MRYITYIPQLTALLYYWFGFKLEGSTHINLKKISLDHHKDVAQSICKYWNVMYIKSTYKGFFLFRACGSHRLSNPYKLDNISGQIVSILLICAKILLIHVHSFIYFTFHWSYTDVELVMFMFSIINKASVHKLCLIVVS